MKLNFINEKKTKPSDPSIWLGITIATAFFLIMALGSLLENYIDKVCK